MDKETWRFDLAAAEAQAASLPDDKLRADFARHLNYIPGSSYTLVYFRELERRGLEA